jgi:hypothetical protein
MLFIKFMTHESIHSGTVESPLKLIPLEQVDPIKDMRIPKFFEVAEFEKRVQVELDADAAAAGAVQGRQIRQLEYLTKETGNVNTLHQSILRALALHNVLFMALSIPFTRVNVELIDEERKRNGNKALQADSPHMKTQMALRQVTALAAQTLIVSKKQLIPMQHSTPLIHP